MNMAHVSLLPGGAILRGAMQAAGPVYRDCTGEPRERDRQHKSRQISITRDFSPPLFPSLLKRPSVSARERLKSKKKVKDG